LPHSICRSVCAVAVLLAAIVMATYSANAQPRFPADAGVLNVRDFGAKGNGTDDDTKALQAAIDAAGPDTGPAFWQTRMVYLPAGTYLVSHTLERHYSDGKFASGMILIGESRASTILRLRDHAQGFDNPDTPRGVVMTTAKLLDGSPTSGGKDYTNKGEGNDAYENFVEHLTIDVGGGNPGAIGIDYLANNIGAIRDVTVRASPDSGAIGLAMLRKWPGPALLQQVDIKGFDVGIAVGNSEYGVTLDRVRLDKQRRIGLQNAGNAVAAADLVVDAPTPIANNAPGGLVVLTDAALRPGSEESPISGIFNGPQWQSFPGSSGQKLPDNPPPPNDPVTSWVNVLRFANAVPGDRDITQALREAMASGASTIYLPYGRYTISDAIDIPPGVRRIVGMNANITVRPERNPNFVRTSGMFRIREAGPPLTIERVVFDMTNLGDQLAVEQMAQRDLVLRDIVTAGTALLDRKPTGGRTFIEDVCCGKLSISGPAPVYARQLDTEGGETRILNQGSPLTILGLKTEGDCTVLDNRSGAVSRILGGLLYVVHDADVGVPAFRNADATLQASFVEESFRATSRYDTYLIDTSGGQTRQTPAAGFPARGFGRMVPLLTTGR
jgi:Pectate lyase superfamily protein